MCPWCPKDQALVTVLLEARGGEGLRQSLLAPKSQPPPWTLGVPTWMSQIYLSQNQVPCCPALLCPPSDKFLLQGPRSASDYIVLSAVFSELPGLHAPQHPCPPVTRPQ